MPRPTILTQAALARVASLLDHGSSAAEIATEIGCTLGTLSHLRKTQNRRILLTLREYLICAGILVTGGDWQWFFGVRLPRVFKRLIREGRLRPAKPRLSFLAEMGEDTVTVKINQRGKDLKPNPIGHLPPHIQRMIREEQRHIKQVSGID